mmetsp:Transcript_158959/g.289867  ORF Transcript_158959/g.289867 Transcript_158959/m.289867 type:complete len:413 (+) Transcript_158959:37-1275(+)
MFSSVNAVKEDMDLQQGTAVSAPEYCLDFRNLAESFDRQRRIPKRMHRILIARNGSTGDWVGPNTEMDELIDFHEAAKEFMLQNADFELQWWYHDDCERYLAAHFDPCVLQAFHRVKAYAFKVDLMRFAILYREGGWYGDLRHYVLTSLSQGCGRVAAAYEQGMDCSSDMQWFSCCQDGVFVPADVQATFDSDLSASLSPGYNYQHEVKLADATRAREIRVALMQNGFLGAAAGHPFLKIAIAEAVRNVQLGFYGSNPWEPTGPTLLMRSIATYFGDGSRLGRNMLFDGLGDGVETASEYVNSIRPHMPYPEFACFGRFVHAPPEMIEREVYQVGDPASVLVSHKGLFQRRRHERLEKFKANEWQHPDFGPGSGWNGLGGNNYLALWCQRNMYKQQRGCRRPTAGKSRRTRP